MKSSKKKSFSRFNQMEAFKQLGITNLLEWLPAFKTIETSVFLQERLLMRFVKRH
jgi:hypothetical protein